jgi:hypothetical protein
VDGQKSASAEDIGRIILWSNRRTRTAVLFCESRTEGLGEMKVSNSLQVSNSRAKFAIETNHQAGLKMIDYWLILLFDFL